mmetsp:Transcript_77456/g.136629  ORF Transcript_77456/g.136629 Transcript_77456/m.136629 type:complete len:308 (+) Transcript_77456:976-1899(+)
MYPSDCFTERAPSCRRRRRCTRATFGSDTADDSNRVVWNWRRGIWQQSGCVLVGNQSGTGRVAIFLWPAAGTWRDSLRPGTVGPGVPGSDCLGALNRRAIGLGAGDWVEVRGVCCLGAWNRRLGVTNPWVDLYAARVSAGGLSHTVPAISGFGAWRDVTGGLAFRREGCGVPTVPHGDCAGPLWGAAGLGISPTEPLLDRLAGGPKTCPLTSPSSLISGGIFTRGLWTGNELRSGLGRGLGWITRLMSAPGVVGDFLLPSSVPSKAATLDNCVAVGLPTWRPPPLVNTMPSEYASGTFKFFFCLLLV